MRGRENEATADASSKANRDVAAGLDRTDRASSSVRNDLVPSPTSRPEDSQNSPVAPTALPPKVSKRHGSILKAPVLPRPRTQAVRPVPVRGKSGGSWMEKLVKKLEESDKVNEEIAKEVVKNQDKTNALLSGIQSSIEELCRSTTIGFAEVLPIVSSMSRSIEELGTKQSGKSSFSHDEMLTAKNKALACKGYVRLMLSLVLLGKASPELAYPSPSTLSNLVREAVTFVLGDNAGEREVKAFLLNETVASGSGITHVAPPGILRAPTDTEKGPSSKTWSNESKTPKIACMIQ